MKIFLDGKLYNLEDITQEEINRVRAEQRKRQGKKWGK